MLHKLTPSTKDYIWGGTRLKNEYNKKSNTEIIAETWELSCHDDGPCFISDTGLTLKQYLKENPNALGKANARFEDFPMLIKLIDAKSNLSIQVHPNDEYAQKNENQNGKTEVWYIVDCEKDAFIYYGLKEKISAEDFANAIQNNTITDKLEKVEVKKGDVFFIPSGTIHAIGAGCLIAEVQQNSNVTYRVYDYARCDANGNPRELHVEKACDVTVLDKAKKDYDFGTHMATCEYFTSDLICTDGQNAEIIVDEKSFKHILSLDSAVTIKSEEQEIVLEKGEGVFADASTGKLEISSNGSVLVSYTV